MKDWFGLVLCALGIILVIGAIVYGFWLIHPVLGIIALGINLLILGKALADEWY